MVTTASLPPPKWPMRTEICQHRQAEHDNSAHNRKRKHMMPKGAVVKGLRRNRREKQ